jgi:hypothetical protein
MVGMAWRDSAYNLQDATGGHYDHLHIAVMR